MKRTPTILLIVSIVLNIFLLSGIAASVWRYKHEHRAGVDMRDGWRFRAADALPPPQAAAFRKAVRGTVDASQPILNAGQAARVEARRLFVQPQVDVAATTAAFDRARAADTIMRTRVEHAIVRFVATLPQDQRKKLSEALRAGPFREKPTR